MTARLLSFVIWSLVAASAVFWGLRLGASGARAPSHAEVAAADAVPAGRADLSRLFGAAPSVEAPAAAVAPMPAADARFKLIGVVASRAGSGAPGLALIATDGKPARAYGVGARLDDDVVLLSVGHRRVEMGPRGGPASISLELPPLAEAARSTLPAVTPIMPSVAAPAAPVRTAPMQGMPPSTATQPDLVPVPPGAPGQAPPGAPGSDPNAGGGAPTR